MERGESREQVAWGIIDKIAGLVFSMVQKSNNAYLNGQINRWYWNLTGLREMINHELKEPEIKNLDAFEEKITPLLMFWRLYEKAINNGIKPKPEVIKNRNLLVVEIKKYQRYLLSLLKEVGYLPRKEDRSFLGM